MNYPMYYRSDVVTAYRIGNLTGFGYGLLAFPAIYKLVEWAFFS